METKKNPAANLEKGKTLSLLMGLIVAMSIVFVGFEWGTQDVKLLAYESGDGITWEEMMPHTRPDPPPPPPPPAPPAVTDVLTVVDNTADIPDTDIPTSEDTMDRPMEVIPIPVAINEEEEKGELEFVLFAEEMPEFPGGDGEMLRFLSRSIRYPSTAQEIGTQGRVVCSFIIDTEGKVTGAEVVRGIEPSLDKEALRVINSMPKWKPGRQGGKAVRVKYTIPITFKLN